MSGVSDAPEARQRSISAVSDQGNRELRDLRLSVTDRCNFRCVYCMPKKIFGRDFVLEGIDVAHEVGLSPIKINMVVKRGSNDQDVVAMARHFKGTPYMLRFIELMDVGATNGWKMSEVVPSAELISRINAELPLEEVAPNHRGATSVRWRYRDGSGVIGVISSVTQPFCHSCTRMRVSTEGKLFTCLFASAGNDLRALMRNGCSDERLWSVMTQTWRQRADRYSELRSARSGDLAASGTKIEMSYIGG